MTSILSKYMSVNPLSQSEIECLNVLFCEGYYTGDLMPAKLPYPLELTLESYHVDKQHYKKINREDIQKCFELVDKHLETRHEGKLLTKRLSLESLKNRMKQESPLTPQASMAAGLFWRVAERNQEKITLERVKKMPIPDELNDFEKQLWKKELACDEGINDHCGVVRKYLTTEIRRSVVEQVYKEMKEKFEAEEDWVSNSHYDQKIINRRKKLERKRDAQVKERIILTVFLATLGVFFFNSSQETSDSQSQEGFPSN